MRSFIVVVCIGFGLFTLAGCDSSSIKKKSDVNILSIQGNSENNNLDTLSLSKKDIQPILMDSAWKKVYINIASFYENNALPAHKKSYNADMKFGKRDITVYADCKKITANYKIKDNLLTFSNATISPAIDLASCEQFEYADDAVMALLSNTFEIKKAVEKKIVLDAVDFDSEVLLLR